MNASRGISPIYTCSITGTYSIRMARGRINVLLGIILYISTGEAPKSSQLLRKSYFGSFYGRNPNLVAVDEDSAS
jgi:hypothetical protein